MNIIQQTNEFALWLRRLSNRSALARIVARIEAARAGNFGDSKAVGAGVSEMRIDVGPGYRVYFKRVGPVVYVLLCGGSKSTQAADIRKARAMARQFQE